MEHIFTIMGLNVEYIDEICLDIKEQYEKGVATCALFKMTLVPEGNPPADKVGDLCRKYVRFKEKLDAWNIPNGVLVQATIGHGWVLGEMFPFQKYTGIVNGQEDNVVCPYDEGFKDYMYNVFKTIAECSPDHIMLDDDFRLLGRYGGGCGCPLHMKRFNELAGTDLSREELQKIFVEDPEGEYARIFIETQRESLVETAKVMRAGIDSVDPKIPGSFCVVGGNAEFGAEIAKIICGKDQPIVMRVNNGNYTPAGARFFTKSFFGAAAQIAKNKDEVDVFLAETDTCPQNRYSTGAMSVHTHFTGSIIEGVKGAKHWITRLSCYEPASGVAYRKILSRYSGFYSQLTKLLEGVAWRGFRIPVLKEAIFRMGKTWNIGEDYYNGWGECVLERLGLPMYFSAENGGALCLEGEVKLSDSEILEALKGSVFLASDSAEHLIQRGFGEYLGVDVREWRGKSLTAEHIFLNGRHVAAQRKAKELVVTDDSAQIDSMLCNTVIGVEELFPGSVIYKNSLGGTVFTFAGSPRTNYNIVEAFSFLNYSRKCQLTHMLEMTGEVPAYYPNDEEMYFRAGDMPDGSLLCTLFNLGLDPIDEVELVIFRDVSSIEKLMPDGSLKAVDFKCSDGKYVLDANCNTLDPLVLVIK